MAHPLFNHENLNGWNALPGSKWEVTQGIIAGTSPATERPHGILLGDKMYGDFKLKVIYKSVKGNSGLFPCGKGKSSCPGIRFAGRD